MESVRSEQDWSCLNYIAPWEIRRPSPCIPLVRHGARSVVRTRLPEKRVPFTPPLQQISRSLQCDFVTDHAVDVVMGEKPRDDIVAYSPAQWQRKTDAPLRARLAQQHWTCPALVSGNTALPPLQANLHPLSLAAPSVEFPSLEWPLRSVEELVAESVRLGSPYSQSPHPATTRRNNVEAAAWFPNPVPRNIGI
jgi:hypothetical protein